MPPLVAPYVVVQFVTESVAPKRRPTAETTRPENVATPLSSIVAPGPSSNCPLRLRGIAFVVHAAACCRAIV